MRQIKVKNMLIHIRIVTAQIGDKTKTRIHLDPKRCYF